MTTTAKTAIIGTTFGLVTYLLTLFSLPNASQAVELIAPEQYKIVDVTDYPNRAAIEQALNQLAQQGWKVRTTALGGIILAK